MYEIPEIIFRSFWSGIAALGFAILFNASKRSLAYILILGAICGLMKTLMLNHDLNVVQASWIASISVGVLCTVVCRSINVPAFAMAFPSVISMIPGYFAYRGFLGLVELSKDNVDKLEVLLMTVDNGLKVFFILTGLAVGVSIPVIVYRSNLFKKIYKDAV